MHSFTLSLFSSSFTPTGSNKGCSITRGNSYLYNKDHFNKFSSTSYFTLFFSLSLSLFYWITSHVNWKVFFPLAWKIWTKKFWSRNEILNKKNFLPRVIQWKLISSSSSLYLSLSFYPPFVFTYIFIINFSKSLLFSIIFSFGCKFAVLSFIRNLHHNLSEQKKKVFLAQKKNFFAIRGKFWCAAQNNLAISSSLNLKNEKRGEEKKKFNWNVCSNSQCENGLSISDFGL
jgi:hypothetical protein